MRIGIALFEGAEELDWSGPYEVLASWAQAFPEDAVDLLTIGETLEATQCAKGLRVLADVSWPEAGPLDVLVYPGGRGTRSQLEPGDPRHERLRRVAAEGTLLTSVCTGSLVYATAGLLRGRPATTHWASLDLLAKLDPTIDVRAEDRFVDSGSIVTASGVSAGIDMALHLVRRLGSEERAKQVRRAIQYDPEPPV
jgi:transcriptional regulator GlxA family with amidase domain